MEENMINEIEQIFTITLSDGSQLTNLKMHGNAFISQTEITESMFSGKLDQVTFTDGSTTVTHGHMELVSIKQNQNEWWFLLRDLTREEVFEMSVRSDIEFMAMMSDIDMTS